MVVRREKTNRKYLGTRRWGAGNIKNHRGKGDRGGVGKGGKKNKWTYVTAKTPELIRTVGFTPWNRRRLNYITIRDINRMAGKTDGKSTIELRSFKVLSNGSINRAVIVKASGFSEGAMAKIKGAGGEAIKI
ncbi:MAG: uL15m family ribosomal protein [Candidatus Micrarchaeaceae archaeon]